MKKHIILSAVLISSMSMTIMGMTIKHTPTPATPQNKKINFVQRGIQLGQKLMKLGKIIDIEKAIIFVLKNKPYLYAKRAVQFSQEMYNTMIELEQNLKKIKTLKTGPERIAEINLILTKGTSAIKEIRLFIDEIVDETLDMLKDTPDVKKIKNTIRIARKLLDTLQDSLKTSAENLLASLEDDETESEPKEEVVAVEEVATEKDAGVEPKAEAAVEEAEVTEKVAS